MEPRPRGFAPPRTPTPGLSVKIAQPPWQDAGTFAAFFDNTIDRAFRLAVLATRDRHRAIDVIRHAYSDFWITSREPQATRPELRLLTLVREHARR